MSSLSEKDIQARASAQSFAKGQGYYRNGYVSDVVRRGDVVTAVVEGSEYEPYQVQITLDETGVADANCTCPYDWGGDCKHIVAVLLTLVHQAEAVVEKPELETVLDGLTETQLRRVLLNLVAGRPELMAALEREVEWLQKRPAIATSAALSASAPGPSIAAVDEAAVRREISKDFRAAGQPHGRGYDYYDYDDDGTGVDLEEILRPHLDKVESLLADGQAEAAASLLVTIIDTYADGLNELDEWVYEESDYQFEEMTSELAEWLAEVLLSLELSPEEQEEWLAQIESWEGDVGEMELAVTAVTQGWDYPPLVAVLQGHITDKGAWEGEAPDYADQLAGARLRILERQGRFQEYIYLAEAEGETSLYVNMLARAGQVEQALAEARQLLTNAHEYLALAQVLAGQGEMAAALEIGESGLAVPEPARDEFGLRAGSDSGKGALAVWLRDQAEQAGRPSLALQAAKIAFQHSCRLADYQAVERLAGDDWSVVKLELLPTLVSRTYGGEAIDIFLYEGMLMEAMKKIDASSYLYFGGELTKVIAATQEKYPDWGIQKYRQLAERIMGGGKAKDYDTAVSYLRQARDIYLQHQRQDEWRAYLGGLLTTHQRKYKLVPMLREIR
ncbi:MAG: SWIM zinc finger domain-containing protein [Anaerolineae bacterium]|nr:SWIM zinc finger domain-containing protein [Anaerolineae bacterium]